MFDYQTLKTRYLASVQMGLLLGSGYENAKQGNNLLHKFCESVVDNSNYSDVDKQNMKRDLEHVKEVLSHEIELHFRGVKQ